MSDGQAADQAQADLARVRLLRFPMHQAEARQIVPMAVGDGVPFAIQRVFTIQAERAGLTGGQHAHRHCTQLIVCLEGICDLACRTDRESERCWRLDRPDQGLLIPPGIWAEQRYVTVQTRLLVLCDRAYEEGDYIREFGVYQRFRQGVRDAGG